MRKVKEVNRLQTKQDDTKNRFWNFNYTEQGNSLRINGFIAENSWYEDDVTPREFRNELAKCKGDIEVWINSPGGDVFAASQIFSMLKEHKSGNVVVKIDGMAASAASVIAMAGTSIEMSPTSLLMIHNPMTMVFGEASDLEQGIETLIEVKEAILNAYEQKTKLTREKISAMMDKETWMNAKKAVELGFADKVLYADDHAVETDKTLFFDRASFMTSTINALKSKLPKKQVATNEIAIDPQVEPTVETPKEDTQLIDVPEEDGTQITVLEKRLSLIK